MENMEKNHNIIISGVGGQGLVSLAMIIAEAAMASGYDVKTSELHGLSQRGGSVKVNVRFGKKIYSPLVPRQKASLVFVLEYQEAVAATYFANKDTIFLINQHKTATLGKSVTQEKAIREVYRVTRNISIFPETKISSSPAAGVFLLAYAVHNKMIPLSINSIQKAIKKVLKKKYWKINEEAIKLAK